MMAATVERPPTAEQHAAIQAEGLVFVSAGAGTGKTSVLVERFARAVDHGIDVGSILVITYTERAAAELRSRIRARLAELGRPELTRELDGAWISTIHGFCLRLLKQYPFAAGLDPRFRVLDESQAAVLRVEAFEEALAEFCRGGAPERLGLLATYGSAASAGCSPAPTRRCAPPAGRSSSRSATRRRSSSGSRSSARSRPRPSSSSCSTAGPAVESLLDLSGFAVKGDDDYEQARTAVEQAALNALAARDRALLEELLQAFERSYQAAKDRESALDFEDLQLRARDLLRDDDAIREREQLRFRQVCVDEFQDTNRLQCEVIDLIARDDLFFVGDEFQSIYRFRHADVDGLQGAARGGRRRAAADRELALAARGARGRQPALRRDVRRRVPAPGRRRALPRPGRRPGGRAARHRQVELQGHRHRVAAGRGAGRSRGA